MTLAESLKKWLLKIGETGLRKGVPTGKISRQFKSLLPKKIKNLSQKKRRLKALNVMNKPGTSQGNVDAAKNYIAKSKVTDPTVPTDGTGSFIPTVKPLGTGRTRVDVATRDIQLQGNLKGGEYKVKMSGGGDKNIFGSIAGNRGSGNKSLRRSGKSDQITNYEKSGTKPTPLFRRTQSELGTAITDINKPGLQTSPHKWNKGDLYGLSVDIKKSKEHSRGVRELLKSLNKRRSAIQNNKPGMTKETDAMRKRLEGNL
tara:strand:- start:953 stop:1726 length:774 start_codon:yes stop_codon:yes gene_type:complete